MVADCFQGGAGAQYVGGGEGSIGGGETSVLPPGSAWRLYTEYLNHLCRAVGDILSEIGRHVSQRGAIFKVQPIKGAEVQRGGATYCTVGGGKRRFSGSRGAKRSNGDVEWLEGGSGRPPSPLHLLAFPKL